MARGIEANSTHIESGARKDKSASTTRYSVMGKRYRIFQMVAPVISSIKRILLFSDI